MTRSRLIGTEALLALAVYGAAGLWLFYGTGARYRELAGSRQGLTRRIQALSAGKSSAREALEQVQASREAYRRRLKDLEALLIRPDPKYLPEGKEDPANYFMQMLVRLREECRKDGGPSFESATPLGFTPELRNKKKGGGSPERLLLLRLAAAERLLAALRKAGVPHVVKVEHLAPRPASRLEGLYEGAVILPVAVRLAAPERSVAEFLGALLTPGTACGLESLELNATAEYEGLLVNAVLDYYFLGAGDVLPAEREGPRLPVRGW